MSAWRTEVGNSGSDFHMLRHNMDSHPNSSIVHVGDYEYNTRDLIGHGAFAVVFKGRHRKVRHNSTQTNVSFFVFIYL